jgi:hypothetical protein
VGGKPPKGDQKVPESMYQVQWRRKIRLRICRSQAWDGAGSRQPWSTPGADEMIGANFRTLLAARPSAKQASQPLGPAASALTTSAHTPLSKSIDGANSCRLPYTKASQPIPCQPHTLPIRSKSVIRMSHLPTLSNCQYGGLPSTIMVLVHQSAVVKQPPGAYGTAQSCLDLELQRVAVHWPPRRRL